MPTTSAFLKRVAPKFAYATKINVSNLFYHKLGNGYFIIKQVFRKTPYFWKKLQKSFGTGHDPFEGKGESNKKNIYTTFFVGNRINWKSWHCLSLRPYKGYGLSILIRKAKVTLYENLHSLVLSFYENNFRISEVVPKQFVHFFPLSPLPKSTPFEFLLTFVSSIL